MLLLGNRNTGSLIGRLPSLSLLMVIIHHLEAFLASEEIGRIFLLLESLSGRLVIGFLYHLFQGNREA